MTYFFFTSISHNSFALCKSPLGFKRKVELFNKGQSDVIKHYVKPYAERREERLKRYDDNDDGDSYDGDDDVM